MADPAAMNETAHSSAPAPWLVCVNSREFTSPDFTNSMPDFGKPDFHTEKSEFRVGDKLGGAPNDTNEEERLRDEF